MSDQPVYSTCPACSIRVSDLEGHMKERAEYGDASHNRAYSRLLDEQEGRAVPPADAPVTTPAAPVEPPAPAVAAHEPPVLPPQPATTAASPASPGSGETTGTQPGQ